MERLFKYAPRVAIFLAGVAAGALTGTRRDRAGMEPAVAKELKRSLAGLEDRLVAQESASAARFTQIEARLEEHAGKLAEVPSTAQIVAAMEQLLSKTMSSLDDRLTTQAGSIEVLKTTVSQTDSLLERVLESLDSLQAYTDPSELTSDALLQRPVV
jgi:chromosome segregation ATPase